MTDSEKLDTIMAQLNSIEERLPPSVASASQIRGKYGDPKVNFDPKVWNGQSFKGLAASQCSADFCEAYAETLEYMARNPKPDSDPKFVGYNRKDARLFRRWAIELREGRADSSPKAATASLFQADAPPRNPLPPSQGDDDIPF